jgi:two-component system chemotaxis response regulator CheY
MSKKVMIADDSASMRSFVTGSLLDLDVETIEVCNGYEALKVLPQHRFDLIILDINMPEMNGLEVLRFVKNHESYKKIHAIVISTDHNKADVKMGLVLGADRYLTKPFEIERLKDTICEVLSI